MNAGHKRKRRPSLHDDANQWSEPSTLEEKRLLYACGDNYVELSKVQQWESYARERELVNESNEHMGVLNRKVSLFHGDSTTLEVDAIVNAAKESLLGGGGIDGAIHRAAGGMLQQECRTLGGCETGDAKLTNGYRLPAKYVLHTVGPREEDPILLKSCYESCLKLVLQNGIRSVAFCGISTGIFGYPLAKAARIAVETVKTWLKKYHDEVDRIIFAVFLDKERQVYEELLAEYFPVMHEDQSIAVSSSVDSERENNMSIEEREDDSSDNEEADQELIRMIYEEERQAAEEATQNATEKDEDEDEEESNEKRENPEKHADLNVDRKEGNVLFMGKAKVNIESARLNERIVQALKTKGIMELFSVQRAVVPTTIAMSKSGTPGDICVGSPTGSGKTLAYVLPIQELLLKYRNRTLRAIIVVPTAALASQVLSEFDEFEPYTGIKARVVSGVIHQDIEVKSLIETTVVNNQAKHRILADVVIGTPAPILAHMKSTPGFSIGHLELMVFDEVDTLLQNDMIGQTGQIVQNYNHSENVLERQRRSMSSDVPFPAPQSRVRKIVCSATLGTDTSKLEQLKLFRPQFFMHTGSAGGRTKKYTLPTQLQQSSVTYVPTYKPLYFIYLMKDIIADDNARVLCFTNSNLSAQRLHDYLKLVGFTNMALFTRLMSTRDQKITLQGFAHGQTNLLISSDSIARGTDFHVNYVVNYELPRSLKTYVHRVGRTARADHSGQAFNFVLDSEFPRLSGMLSRVDGSDLRDQPISTRDIEIYKEDYMEYLRSTFARQKRIQKGGKSSNPDKTRTENVLKQLNRE